MESQLRKTFAASKAQGRPTFVAFLTAGFPSMESTVPCLLGMQNSGADVIEVGVPFSDPLADGATIQMASTCALKNGTTVSKTLDLVREARKQGLTVPVVLMGYYNPILRYGLDKIAAEAAEAGANGFIVVDLPPEEAHHMLTALEKHSLSFVPLVTPTTTEDRIAQLADVASSFIYCVSVSGVTGQRTSLAADLPAFLQRVRNHTSLPLAVGFGISKREHVETVAKHADGAVVGSAIISTVAKAGDDIEAQVAAASDLVQSLTGGKAAYDHTGVQDDSGKERTSKKNETAESFTFDGTFGGRFIPETLVHAHKELWDAWLQMRDNEEFRKEMDRLRRDYIGGPTPLWRCDRLTAECGGAEIWLKREDLAHTGAHKINNALGQVLLAKKLGKHRIIAETGAGQHGVATATACALLGLECVVYMGAEDTRRQSLNVFRMKVLGAEVHPVTSGSQTLKDAINEAMRDWVTNVTTTHYCIGSAVGPHPFPHIVRDIQSVIGQESREQFLEQVGSLPDAVLACVGGGSNAIGMFHPFVGDASVRLIGVEAGGAEGPGPGKKHSASLVGGTPGVLHGTMTYLLQDDDGQITETHSVSAGLDYPGVGPEHAHLKAKGRAEYVFVTDSEALDAFQQLAQKEGIIPALESAHAVAYAMKLAKTLGKDKRILINLSGRGDKDMITVAKLFGHSIDDDGTSAH